MAEDDKNLCKRCCKEAKYSAVPPDDPNCAVLSCINHVEEFMAEGYCVYALSGERKGRQLIGFAFDGSPKYAADYGDKPEDVVISSEGPYVIERKGSLKSDGPGFTVLPSKEDAKRAYQAIFGDDDPPPHAEVFTADASVECEAAKYFQLGGRVIDKDFKGMLESKGAQIGAGYIPKEGPDSQVIDFRRETDPDIRKRIKDDIQNMKDAFKIAALGDQIKAEAVKASNPAGALSQKELECGQQFSNRPVLDAVWMLKSLAIGDEKPLLRALKAAGMSYLGVTAQSDNMSRFSPGGANPDDWGQIRKTITITIQVPPGA